MTYRSVYCIAVSHAQAHRVINRLNEIEVPSSETSVLFLDLEKESAARVKPSLKNARASKPLSAAYSELGEENAPLTTVIAGVGPLVALGPVAAISSDAATYGIAGGLREFGVPASEASRYESRIKEGHVFLAIRTENPDKSDRAREVFVAESAEDIRTLMHVLTPKISRRSLHGQARVTVG